MQKLRPSLPTGQQANPEPNICRWRIHIDATQYPSSQRLENPVIKSSPWTINHKPNTQAWPQQSPWVQTEKKMCMTGTELRHEVWMYLLHLLHWKNTPRSIARMGKACVSCGSAIWCTCASPENNTSIVHFIHQRWASGRQRFCFFTPPELPDELGKLLRKLSQHVELSLVVAAPHAAHSWNRRVQV